MYMCIPIFLFRPFSPFKFSQFLLNLHLPLHSVRIILFSLAYKIILSKPFVLKCHSHSHISIIISCSQRICIKIFFILINIFRFYLIKIIFIP